MALTKDEAIKELRKALNDIVRLRRDWNFDYPDVVDAMRDIAIQALNETKMMDQEDEATIC